LKDEAQLSMNELLIDTTESSLNYIENYDRANEIKSKLNELKSLTFEEDGSKKGKLIMNVSPYYDQQEQTELLKLPDEIVQKNQKLVEEKTNKKNQIQNLKEQWNDSVKLRESKLKRIEELKSKLNNKDQTFNSSKRKLDKLIR